MLFAFFRVHQEDPLKSVQLAALKEKLLAEPKNEPLKSQIRQVDLKLRERHFWNLELKRSGGWLAMGGAIVFVLAARSLSSLRQTLPVPKPGANPEREARRTLVLGRRSVAVVGSTLAVALIVASVLTGSSLSDKNGSRIALRGEKSGLAASPADFPSVMDLQKNWPQFRGPEGIGISHATNLPIHWDAKSGDGVLWKAEVPGRGFNSPIVWGGKIFVSGGDASKREVFCFEAEKGGLLWRQAPANVPGARGPAPEVPEQTGYAASTMATDGRRVYVMFANGDLAAFSLEGKQMWATNLALNKNPHGHATSLVTWQDRLLVQVDQGEPEQNASRLYAFDAATGRIAWQRTRPVPTSWATPIVFEHGGRTQVVALGVPWIMAYSAQDGTELWRAEGLANEITPSAAYADGLVYAVSPNDKVYAIRADGQGDVTKTHVAWSAEDNIPDISSPVSSGGLVFTASTPGVVTCYDAKDGKKQWEQDFAAEMNASPTVAGAKLYLFMATGAGVVVQAARQFDEIAKNDVGERIYASPAMAGDKIFIRGLNHLFCVGTQSAAAPRNP